jgi:adenylate kinase
MGVAGSGKSSQGREIADEKGLPWLSTGEFLRMLIAGEKRKDMLSGKLLSDEEIISLIRKIFAVVNTDEEFVLDGFPRTVAQADWLLNQNKHGQLPITAVVHLIASEAAVEKRLLARGRQDDTAEAIKERFREYNEEMVPILEHFKAAGVRVIDVNAERPVSEVHTAILKALAEEV